MSVRCASPGVSPGVSPASAPRNQPPVARDDDPCVELLYTASQEGRSTDVLAMLRARVYRAHHIRRALCIAASSDHANVLQAILQKIPYVNVPLSELVSASCAHSIAELTPLYGAAHHGSLESASVLVEAKVDVNNSGSSFTRPLAAAARGGHTEVLQLLIDAKADVDREVRSEEPLLVDAIEGGESDCVQALLQAKATANPREPEGPLGVLCTRVPMCAAARRNRPDMLELLIAAKGDVDGAPIHVAAGHGCTEAVHTLRHHGAQLRERDGWTVLMLAACKGHAATVQRLLVYDPQLADVASTRTRLCNGRAVLRGSTPLDMAREFEHEGVAALLHST